MGESNSKPTAFKITLNNSHRYMLFLTMSPVTKCPQCNSGPFDTTDAIKLIRYGKVWDLFGLTDFENLPQEKLIELFSSTEPQEFTIDTEILRFLIDLLLTRSYVLNTFAPVLAVVTQLLKIINDYNIKLPGTEEENLIELDTPVTLTLAYTELESIGMIMLAAKKCNFKFALSNGESVEHGTTLDFPNTVKTFTIYERLLTQLGLLSFMTGSDSVAAYAGFHDFTLDVGTSKYLKNLIASRSTTVNFPQHKLASIISKL